MKESSFSPTFILLSVTACVILALTISYTCAYSTSALNSLEDFLPFHHNNITSTDHVIPWPGYDWIHKWTVSSSKASHKTFVDTSTGITYSSVYEAILKTCDSSTCPYKNFNSYINSYFLPYSWAVQVIQTFGIHHGYYILSYLRNLIAGMFMYYVTAGIFHYHCYIHPRSHDIFSNRIRPTRETILDQIQLAQASLFVYVALPVLSDYLVEEGYTKCYYALDEIGGIVPYLLWTVVYFLCVEVGIYWMHRTLHENKILYKYIHMLHHKYSRPDTLTPWASIAFNPLDGILQACPYVYLLPIVPCHYLTHVVFLFFTAVWATYIHDAMDWNIDPIMGSKYHTIHHTHYIYNYGQVFTFCDRIWGTLRVPVGKTGVLSGPQKITLLPAKPGWFGGSGRGKLKSI